MSIFRKISGTTVNRQHGRGFTLLEVMLSLAILVLLAGAVYAMVDASVVGTSELETKEDRSHQLTAFLELSRKTFHALPANGLFGMRIVQQGDKYVPELVFRNSRGLFRWGDVKNEFASTVLGVRPKVGGLVDLSILQDSEDEITSYLNGGTAKRPWLVLLPDLQDVEWRFYDPRSQVWMKTWQEQTVRPAFAELTLTTEEGTGTYVFWLPPVQMK